MKEYINPPALYKSSVYSHAVKAGNIIFVSGQCANVPQDHPEWSEGRRAIRPGDPYFQARLCYQNLREALFLWFLPAYCSRSSLTACRTSFGWKGLARTRKAPKTFAVPKTSKR